MEQAPTTNPLGPIVPVNSATVPSYDTILTGKHVTLRATSPTDAATLFPHISGPNSASLFDYLFDAPYPNILSLETALTRKRTTTNPWTFSICRPHPTDPHDEEALGFLSLMRMDLPHRSIEVGSILFSPALQRTAAATEVIYLLARHVFDDLGFRRFEWKCNSLNAPSKRAAERYGFRFEGRFRKHMIIKGRSRDTDWYAMVDEDWRGVREAMEGWLGEGNFDEEGRQRRRLEEFQAWRGKEV
ncbi:acyl-CoA N-acyltransferase [Elsinoe ampelina]|uniref:Acyl-CoA N-acyltransferase n=1 Tax=Elsinoe ampelina TaxID=302913 RepID=A0A6A6G0U8_9PEZI|nr:acyl-CoA N-acyltransferase [Elsinoe ampelina]